MGGRRRGAGPYVCAGRDLYQVRDAHCRGQRRPTTSLLWEAAGKIEGMADRHTSSGKIKESIFRASDCPKMAKIWD